MKLADRTRPDLILTDIIKSTRCLRIPYRCSPRIHSHESLSDQLSIPDKNIQYKFINKFIKHKLRFYNSVIILKLRRLFYIELKFISNCFLLQYMLDSFLQFPASLLQHFIHGNWLLIISAKLEYKEVGVKIPCQCLIPPFFGRTCLQISCIHPPIQLKNQYPWRIF